MLSSPSRASVGTGSSPFAMAAVCTGCTPPLPSDSKTIPSLSMFAGPASCLGGGWKAMTAQITPATIARIATEATVGTSHLSRRCFLRFFSRARRAASRASSRRWFLVWRGALVTGVILFRSGYENAGSPGRVYGCSVLRGSLPGESAEPREHVEFELGDEHDHPEAEERDRDDPRLQGGAESPHRGVAAEDARREVAEGHGEEGRDGDRPGHEAPGAQRAELEDGLADEPDHEGERAGHAEVEQHPEPTRAARPGQQSETDHDGGHPSEQPHDRVGEAEHLALPRTEIGTALHEPVDVAGRRVVGVGERGELLEGEHEGGEFADRAGDDQPAAEEPLD